MGGISLLVKHCSLPPPQPLFAGVMGALEDAEFTITFFDESSQDSSYTYKLIVIVFVGWFVFVIVFVYFLYP